MKWRDKTCAFYLFVQAAVHGLKGGCATVPDSAVGLISFSGPCSCEGRPITFQKKQQYISMSTTARCSVVLCSLAEIERGKTMTIYLGITSAVFPKSHTRADTEFIRLRSQRGRTLNTPLD